MPLTDSDLERIEAIVKDNTCACGLSPPEQKRVGHLMGMLEDVGGGDCGRGVEVFRGIAKRNSAYGRVVRTIEAGVLATATGWAVIRVINAIGQVLDKTRG